MNSFDPSETNLNFIPFFLLVEKIFNEIEIVPIQYSDCTEKITWY